MPILHNAKKALRVSKKRGTINQRVKSRVKTMLDKLADQPSAEKLAAAFASLDKAVNKKVFHKNKAARLKSQASKLLVTKAK